MALYLHHHKSLLLSLILAGTCCVNQKGLLAQTDLIISEYIEGSVNNKCIEIFNPTNSVIALSNYTLNFYNNGNTMPSFSFPLTGSLTSKAVHVICHSAADPVFQAAADQSFFGIANYNGNDAISLERSGALVDLIGNIGCDPGTGWTNGGFSTLDATLVRKACQDNGISTDPGNSGCSFPSLASEWLAYGQDESSHLGSHDYLYTIYDITTIAPSDCGSDDGSLIISVDGFGVEYSINGGATFAEHSTYTGLSAGNYDVIIRVVSDHGCAYTETVTISDQISPAISNIDVVNPSDCGIENGEIHIVATGINLEYSIDDGSSFVSSPDFANLAAGTYEVQVRTIGTINCIDVSSASLLAPTPPVISQVSVTPTTDCGIADGTLSISATGSSLQYSIDNGTNWSSSSIHPLLPPGTYDIFVRKTSSPACVDEATAVIGEPESPLAMLDQITNSNCKGTATGSIELSVSGGSGNFHFHWNGPTPTGDVANATGLKAGIYHVTISDASSPACQDVLDNLVITEPNSDPPLVMLDPISDLCELDPAYVLPDVQQGYSGNWSGPGISNNAIDASGLSGNIALTFTPDNGQCALSNTIEITVIPPITPKLDALASICNLDESIELPTIQDGLIGIWSGPGVDANGFDPRGLSGDIPLTFTPDNGQCARESRMNVMVHNAQSPTLPNIADQCQTNDPLELRTVQNGVTGVWSGPGIRDNDFDPAGLAGLVLIEFVPESGQCALPAQSLINVVLPQVPSLDVTPDICINNGSLTLDPVQDGLIGSWSGPGVSDNTFNPSGLSDPISLLFTPASSQCGIPASLNINLIQPPTLNFIKVEPDCEGNQNGSLEVLVNGGIKPLMFDWHLDGSGDFDDDEILSNLAAGDYKISVKDQTSCTATTTATLSQPSKLIAKVQNTPETSAGAKDGSAEVLTFGGTPPFKYQWSTGSEARSIDMLPPGSYSLTVTDDHGCQDQESFFINSGNCILEAMAITKQVRCWGENNGSVTIEVNNGVSPYNYKWLHDSLLTGSELDDLTAGSFQVTVIDAAGCQVPVSFNITQPSPLIAKLESQDISMEGVNDGQIVVTTAGGTMPYSYSWNHGSIIANQEELSPGEYILTTKDAHGCTNENRITINAPNCNLDVDLQFTPVTCFAANTGVAGLMIKGGSPPYFFSWSHDSLLTDSMVNNLAAGTYEVTISDHLGCSQSKQFSIVENPAMTLEAQIDHATKMDTNDGSIVVNATGGTEPYHYEWFGGQTGPQLNNLPPDTYKVMVTDDEGCEVKAEFSVAVQDCQLDARVSVDSAECSGERNGQATLIVSGGVEPYRITWSFDTSLHEFEVKGLGAGQYDVTIEDAQQCADTISFVVNEPELLRIAFEARNETFLGARDGQILTRALGGTPPYQFRWNSGQTTDSIGGLKPGTYIVTLEDSHGCMAIRSTKINPANCTLLSNVGVRDAKCHGESSGRARLDITSEALPVHTRWSHDTLLQSNIAENLAAGTYSVTITDQDECQHTWPFVVEQPESLSFISEITHQSLAGLADGSIDLEVSGGTPSYRIVWSDSTTGRHRSNLLPGVYRFEIFDENNCVIGDSIEILGSEVCILQLSGVVSAGGCDNSGRIELSLSGERGEVNLEWMQTEIPENTKLATGLAPGQYTVRVSDDFCSVSDTFNVPSDSIKDVSYQVGQSLCIGGDNTFKILAIEGGTAPFQFSLNGQSIQFNNDIQLSQGNHTLQVTDSKSCDFQITFPIDPQSDLVLYQDTTIKRGEELILTGQLPGPEDFFMFRWIGRQGTICDQCLSITTDPTESTKYIFEVKDLYGCISRQEFNIRVDSRDLIYIPNVYTPNGDGVNDAFIVHDGLELIEQIESLEVYDRTGMKIYQAHNLAPNEEAPNFMTILEEAISPQVYMYIINIRFKQGNSQTIKSDFIILR